MDCLLLLLQDLGRSQVEGQQVFKVAPHMKELVGSKMNTGIRLINVVMTEACGTRKVVGAFLQWRKKKP